VGGGGGGGCGLLVLLQSFFKGEGEIGEGEKRIEHHIIY